MSGDDLHIHDDIRRSESLPGRFYGDPEVFELCKERIFARSWQWVGDLGRLRSLGSCLPATLLPGLLGEEVLFTRDGSGELRCLSNVCTHRGALVCPREATVPSLRCPYHGRRYSLDGRFLSMPEFEGVADFPSEKDDLVKIPFGLWQSFVFASLKPAFPFEDLVAEMEARVGWLPIGDAALDPARCRDYSVEASWALYCDNYLEGFHVPYVHAGLLESLDYSKYTTELFPFSSVQIGEAKEGEEAFELPRSSPDFGRRVAGYYFWLFPGTMLNFYPWGISVNLLRPLAPGRTKISFLSYVWDSSKLDRGAGSGLERVELEDEEVVQSVQRGVRSRFHGRGRYSPSREQGVHHFHRLLARFLREAP